MPKNQPDEEPLGFHSFDELRQFYLKASSAIRIIILKGIRSIIEEKEKFDLTPDVMATVVLFLEGQKIEEIALLQKSLERTVRRRLQLVLKDLYPLPPKPGPSDTIES